MEKRQMLMEMRQNGTLKGMKPAFVVVKQNKGGVYNGKSGDYIMSYKDDVLYFQSLTLWFKKLNPKDDFEISIKPFVEFKLRHDKKYSVLKLISASGKYLPIFFFTDKTENFSCDNIDRLLRELEKTHNIKYIEEK